MLANAAGVLATALVFGCSMFVAALNHQISIDTIRSEGPPTVQQQVDKGPKISSRQRNSSSGCQ